MRTVFVDSRLVALLAACAIAGCSGGPSPAEVEAQRAKANAAWNAQAAAAEHARQNEENRLVQQELSAHAQREDADRKREDEAAERDRLSALVAARFPDPQSVQLADVHWNAQNTALCGSARVRNETGVLSAGVGFVASGDEALLDSAETGDHARFVDAAQTNGCMP